MADFEIGYVLLCDDARKEITGKDILIGVYTTGINVSQLPAGLNLAIWLEIIPKKKGQIELEIKAETPGNVPPNTIRIAAIVEDISYSIGIATPPTGFLIQKEGDIRISVKSSNVQKWKLVKRVKVQYKAPMAISVPPPAPPTT